MTRKAQQRVTEILPKGRFMKLLVLLLGMLVLSPLFEEFFKVRIFGDIFFTLILIYAAYSFSRSKALVAAAVSLAVPTIASFWLKPFFNAEWVGICGGLCGLAFMALIIAAILRHIFLQQDVTADIIAGAIVAYLLMAVMWSMLYDVLEAVHPGSFKFPEGTTQPREVMSIYFSLVTITTVGYGDITPVTRVARAFANLEAVVGQLYLVILVSWLVGMYVSARSK
jgi:voltage-gated potassium channel Kch